MSCFCQFLHVRIYYVHRLPVIEVLAVTLTKIERHMHTKYLHIVIRRRWGQSSHYNHYNFLSGSDHVASLKQILKDTKEVTRWYTLGILLGIKTSDLKKIEKNCSSDTERCRIEVIDYWLHNDPEPIQSKLAQAVEDMGGHANVVQTLRGSCEGW